MKLLVSILKYPPDYTGAGFRINNMYNNLLDRKEIDEVFVITTNEQNISSDQPRSDHHHIRYVGFNPYVDEQNTLGLKIKKTIYVLKMSFHTVVEVFKLIRQIDLVHTVDSSWLSTIVGWCAFLASKPLVKEIVLLGADDPKNINNNKWLLTRHFFLFPFKYAKLVIVLSQGLKRSCLESGIPAAKIWYRFNPVYIRCDNHNGREKIIGIEIDNSRPSILSVARISERKNTRFLLDAAFYLDREVQLIFVGPSDDCEYDRKIRKIAEELESATEGKITAYFVGRITDRNVLSFLYEKSKLFWFASKNEGMPNVILESLLCGTPVVSLDIAGVMRELIVSDNDGELLEEEDPELFAKLVNKWLNKMDIDRASIKRRAVKRFNPKTIESEYVKQFKQLIM